MSERIKEINRARGKLPQMEKTILAAVAFLTEEKKKYPNAKIISEYTGYTLMATKSCIYRLQKKFLVVSEKWKDSTGKQFGYRVTP